MINKCLIIVSEQNPISIQHEHISFYKTYVFLQQCHIDWTFFYIVPNVLVCHNQIVHKFRTYLWSHRHNAVSNSFAMQHTRRAKIFKLFVLRKKKVGPNKYFSGHFTQRFAFNKKKSFCEILEQTENIRPFLFILFLIRKLGVFMGYRVNTVGEISYD